MPYKTALVRAGLACVLLAAGALAMAGPKSMNYSMEYTVLSAAGASTSSPNYSGVQRVLTKGVGGTAIQSFSYSIEPVGGTAATSAVADWSLY